MINANAIEMTTATGYLTYGLERTDKFCGVAIGAEGFPFLVLFHQMEPDAPQGSIQIEQETDEQGHSTWTIDHMDLPSDITKFRVLLFSSTVNTGRSECKAIEALRNLGVQEDRITLLFILCSTDSLETICDQFPEVRIITSAIDSRKKIAMETKNCQVLLQAVAGVARTVRSLYGPSKLRKQVTGTVVYCERRLLSF
ncbi:hypothetical protein PHPALM_12888 [Phytophthora palmivora]|uniref:Phosphoribosyltransferase domain-containing protein n=1 Tax=Phytophthora palmivora TaxID=4796 RepID=A0A2P4XYM1_9STRA|nr:hypothetical protein PHPALM_12888 [Phytophthora palmivora]